MLIGCHLSVSRGFAAMLERGVELGANVVQYFPKNPRSYRLKQFSRLQLQRDALQGARLGVTTVCHSPYVTKLSTPDPTLRQLSIDSIVNDLEIANAYGTPYLVVHCGKHAGEGALRGRELMVQGVDQVMRQFTGDTLLLMENTAGQGTELGQTIDELYAIHSALEKPERVGICFDTCHAFAAGVLDFAHWERFVARFTHPDFLPLVRVIHLNDSKMPFGSRKDRHALVGQGEIGAERLSQFLHIPGVKDRPLALETPIELDEQYADEFRTVRSWF